MFRILLVVRQKLVLQMILQMIVAKLEALFNRRIWEEFNFRLILLARAGWSPMVLKIDLRTALAAVSLDRPLILQNSTHSRISTHFLDHVYITKKGTNQV